MVKFQNSSSLIGRVKEALHSYDSAGLIDEGKFYYWIKEALGDLGLDVMQKAEAVLNVERYKLAIPLDMVDFYSIERCTSLSNKSPQLHKQGELTWYIETDKCEYQRKKCCDIEEEGEKITQRVYINSVPFQYNYKKEGLLRYNPRGSVKRDICSNNSPCRGAKSGNDFYFDGSYFYFNFDEDSVFIKYYVFPTEDGLPMIPTETIIQRFLEKKLIFELLKSFWMNSDSPDLLTKMQWAEKELTVAYSDAKHYTKIPSFKELLAWKQSQTSNFSPYEY